MKFHFHLPSISLFKKPATQDTENARNRHVQEASPPPDLQPANTNRHHHHSPSWLKKLLPRKKKSGMPAHASYEAPGPSSRQNNLPQAVSIHRPTFEPSHPIWNEVDMAEKQVAESITQHFSPDALRTAKFKNMVQDCINHDLNALDQKFDQIVQNLLPGQSLDDIKGIREHAKEYVLQSAHDACYALYANEIAGIEKDVVGTIRYALAESGRNTLPELKKKMQFCINYGLNALDQKFDQIVQNLLPGQSRSSIERRRERAKEHIIQSTSEVRHVIRANMSETAQIEKEVAGIIANFLSEIGKDTLSLFELKNRAQDCIDHGLNVLDQKFNHMLQNLPPWQSPDKLERTKEQAQEHVLQSVHEACHALYAKEMDRIEKDVVKTITYALVGSDPSELENMAEDCIIFGSDELNQKFDHILRNLLPGQPRDKIERAREQAKERIVQSTREVSNAINANVKAMTQIEEEVAGIIAKSLSEIEKDTFTPSEFKDEVQDHIDQGLDVLDKKFDHLLQNLLPGQSRDKIEKTREQAKERIIQSIDEACRKAGWLLPLKKGSNIVWESPTAPLLFKRGLSLHQLKLNKANIAEGSFGSVSIFENENGDKLIGKISKNNTRDRKNRVIDDLAEELEAYQFIYDIAGPHPNLVNAYGIAQVPNNGAMKRTMLMDAIPGPTGEGTFDALRKCWDAGKITSEQYWGAVQFIGRRLLDVTGHMAKAGVVHNDIKPENFLVNEKTGEPVLIDLGLWSVTGAKRVGGTPIFNSPEAKNRKGVDERSDVFTVGASLVHGVERHDLDQLWPNEGLIQRPALKDKEGNVTRLPGSYDAETAYTRFMDSILEKNKDIRVNSDMAKKLDFLNDSMLDDDAAKEVITDALKKAREEEQKPKEKQWKQAKPQIRVPQDLRKHMEDLINPFLDNPDLAGYATLQNESKINPRLRNFLNTDALDYLQDDLEQEAAQFAGELIARAPWFDAAQKITETVNIRSGVDKNGVRLNPEIKNIDSAYESSVIQAKKDLESHADIEDLRHYAKDSEAFLRNAMALKNINDPDIADQLEQVQERAAVARRMVEIFDTESEKPVNRVQEFEHQKLERQLQRQLKRRK